MLVGRESPKERGREKLVARCARHQVEEGILLSALKSELLAVPMLVEVDRADSKADICVVPSECGDFIERGD